MSANTFAEGLSKAFASKSFVKDFTIAERDTGPSARALLFQAGLQSESIHSDSDYTILDNACGTGIVTVALYETFKGKEGKLNLVCGDISASMIESVKERILHLEGLKAEALELNGQVGVFSFRSIYHTEGINLIGTQRSFKPFHACSN
jgi:SAM-dependent methyltransferase